MPSFLKPTVLNEFKPALAAAPAPRVIESNPPAVTKFALKVVAANLTGGVVTPKNCQAAITLEGVVPIVVNDDCNP